MKAKKKVKSKKKMIMIVVLDVVEKVISLHLATHQDT